MNPHIQAIYREVGRAPAGLSKQMPNSVAAASAINSKFKVFQQAEMHDEYLKLVDVVSDLKLACQDETEKRVKAIARVRRLEEIVALKDKKIESLLQGRATGATECGDDFSGPAPTMLQRELAQRDRHNHVLIQKLRYKIAQQARMLSAYEDAMQTIRTGSKSTSLMELEEERGQLYEELRRMQHLLSSQRSEMEEQNGHATGLAEMEARYQAQLAKLQQENKRAQLEKHKLGQDITFLRSHNESLQQQLGLEQRKRTYDRQVSTNGRTITSTATSPNRDLVFTKALEDMKTQLRKEIATSITRERIKAACPAATSPKSAPILAPEVYIPAASFSVRPVSTPKTPTRDANSQTPQRHGRPHSSGTPRSSRIHTASTTDQVIRKGSASSDAGAPLVAPAPKTIDHSHEAMPLNDRESSEESTLDSLNGDCDCPGEMLTTGESAEDLRHSSSNNLSVSDGQPGSHMKVVESPVILTSTCAEPIFSATREQTSEHDDGESATDLANPSDRDGNGHLLQVAELELSRTIRIEDPRQCESSDSHASETTSGGEPSIDQADIHQQKLREVERMLREVEDDMGDDQVSNSSEEFLEVAHAQIDLHHHDLADEGAHESAADSQDMAIGDERHASSGPNWINEAKSLLADLSSDDLGYQSDFTEGDLAGRECGSP